jgi:hypothetical protein
MIWNAWTNRDNSKVPWFATPERAWLMMDPARASRYTESLETLKGYLADHPVPNVELISFVDPENKLEPTGNPWWHLGHILSWEDQGLDLFMMANIGMKMKLKWNVRELSDEQNAILKTSKEIPEEKRGQVIDWFHKEIKQSFNNQVKKSQWSWKKISQTVYSDFYTFCKGFTRKYYVNPESSVLIFGNM